MKRKNTIIVQSYKLLTLQEYRQLAKTLGARVPDLGDKIGIGQVSMCRIIDFLGDDGSLSEEELVKPVTFIRIDRRKRGRSKQRLCAHQYYHHEEGDLINYVFMSNK
jgi:hypothetical protein